MSTVTNLEASEFGNPGPLGAHETATKRWGRAVADLLWPVEECVEYACEIFAADEEEIVDLRRIWEEHGR